MDYRISFSEEAENDLSLAFKWYEEQLPDLGSQFLSSVKNTTIEIIANPFAYSFRKQGIRGCKVNRFPYVILFFIEGQDIRVISVFHMSRKPKG